MANTLHITREHLDKTNYYIGPDVTNFDGDIVLEDGLGEVNFKTGVSASGSIIAKHGTGIIAKGSIRTDGGIKAGRGILSSGSIEAGESIQAGHSIEARWGIDASTDIEAGGSIRSGWVIRAGRSIFAKHPIDADASIEAGGVIEADLGIKAGYSISCKTLSAGLPIFAGTATWVRPEKEQTQIRCEKLYGTVAYGELVIKGEEVA